MKKHNKKQTLTYNKKWRNTTRSEPDSEHFNNKMEKLNKIQQTNSKTNRKKQYKKIMNQITNSK